jgi:hypothetical protein
MSTFVPLLGKEQAERLPARAREVVEYRKSGHPPKGARSLVGSPVRRA